MSPLTKQEWIDRLEEPIGPALSISEAQIWLRNRLEYCTGAIPRDREISLELLLWIIHEQARQTIAERTGVGYNEILFTEFVSYRPSTSQAALRFGQDLVATCLGIGGAYYGSAVAALVMAEESIVRRFMMEFVLTVYEPMAGAVAQVLKNHSQAQYSLGDVRVTTVRSSMGDQDGWFSVQQPHGPDVLDESGICVRVHSGGYELQGAFGGSVVRVLRTLEIAIQEFANWRGREEELLRQVAA